MAEPLSVALNFGCCFFFSLSGWVRRKTAKSKVLDVESRDRVEMKNSQAVQFVPLPLTLNHAGKLYFSFGFALCLICMTGCKENVYDPEREVPGFSCS